MTKKGIVYSLCSIPRAFDKGLHGRIEKEYGFQQFECNIRSVICNTIGLKQGCLLLPTYLGFSLLTLKTIGEGWRCKHKTWSLVYTFGIILILESPVGLHDQLIWKITCLELKQFGTIEKLEFMYLYKQNIESVNHYKYVDLDFRSNCRWKDFIEKEIVRGIGVFYVA